MVYHYDNSANNVRNPSRPPQRVLAGNQSTDEMGYLWLQLLPRGPFDRRREIEEALMRHRLSKDPADFGARVTLGALMPAGFNPAAAVTMLGEQFVCSLLSPKGTTGWGLPWRL